MEHKTIGLLSSGVFLVVAAVLFSLGNVEYTEYALNYSLIKRKADRKTYTAGRHFIGFANYFIKFPATVKTIQFSDELMRADLGERGDALLRSRTLDGLEVSLEISFQYQLAEETIYDLFTLLGPFPEYHNTYVRIAIDMLTEVATTYTANDFFTSRTAIGRSMEELLRAKFEKSLFSTVSFFQLRSVGLPAQFEDAIQETEVMKQDIKVAKAEQVSTKVALETTLIQAKRRQQVVANQARGMAQSVLLQNKADIEQYNATQRMAADGYLGILDSLDSKEPELLNYIEARALRDHPSELTTLGLNLPTADDTAAAP